MTRLCSVCQQAIDPERLECLPDTTTCTEHSQARKVRGFDVYGHKTAPTLMFIPDDPEAMRLAYNANARSRGRDARIPGV